ncbi:hypothetical protein J6590_105579, partial [Homalodisca vitripennis]
MRLYIYKDSPSARWGLRPQAPIWVLAKFGDKRSSTFPGGLKNPPTCVRNLVFPALLEVDSPSARWGLRPQAPIWVLAKFGDKRSSVI